MVDVLINCLLKNKETTDDLGLHNGLHNGSPENTDKMEDDLVDSQGKDLTLRAFYEHPLTAATTAMLNINGSNPCEEPNSATIGLLYEYYKMEKSSAANPEVWATAVVNSHSNNDGLTNSIPISLISQTEGLVKETQKVSETNETSSQGVDIYLNGVTKRKPPLAEPLISSAETILPTKFKGLAAVSKINKSIPPDKDRPKSSDPTIFRAKQEPSLGLTQSPSSPSNSITRDIPPLSDVETEVYTSDVYSQGFNSLYEYQLPSQFPNHQATSVYMVTVPTEYRDSYYSEQLRRPLQSPELTSYSDVGDTTAFVERYIRHGAEYKGVYHGLSVDLPSPDSGIEETTATPGDMTILPHVDKIFGYADLTQMPNLLDSDIIGTNSSSRSASSQSGSSKKSWNDYTRSLDTHRVQIPKLYSDVGFHYFLDTPISTNQRRDDDRITYVNKGQFYCVTLEFLTDATQTLKSTTLKSMVILMFREEKPPEEELKAWQFWHSRQHSAKQRILDADTKNCTGIIGQIDEISHNAISFYWSPLEGPAKVNVAVQCLSTDFSNQKGVKGLPMHLQIDTFDDFGQNALPCHRGYCQIKSFCDKGAERKTRDEERRAAKRKINSSGICRKSLQEIYHLPCEKSAFYSMSDLSKPPILFTPIEEIEKISLADLNFYTSQSGPSMNLEASESEVKESDSNSSHTPPSKRKKVYPSDRVLLYARTESEDVFHALHLFPPSLAGLAKAIENQYNVDDVKNVYKKSKSGMTLQLDNDIAKHYKNEDICLVEIIKMDDFCNIVLVEL